MGPHLWCRSPAAASRRSSSGVASGAVDRGRCPGREHARGRGQRGHRPPDRDAPVESSVKCGLPLRQCLMALPGTALGRHSVGAVAPAGAPPVPGVPGAPRASRPTPTTTRRSARWLMFDGTRGVGAIASPLAARLLRPRDVAEDIAESPRERDQVRRDLTAAPPPARQTRAQSSSNNRGPVRRPDAGARRLSPTIA